MIFVCFSLGVFETHMRAVPPLGVAMGDGPFRL